MTFSSGMGVLVGVDILACNGLNLNVKIILSSLGIHLPDKKKKFTFAMHGQKISTPTGTPIPDEKVKELSSYDPLACPSMRALHLPHDAWQQLGTIQPELSAFFWSKGP